MLAEGHAAQPAFTLLAADVEKFKFLKEPRSRTWSRAQDYFLLRCRPVRNGQWIGIFHAALDIARMS
jgi:hypothetical protein